eukprot:1186358-Prorocentrum_minimum.AAC.2
MGRAAELRRTLRAVAGASTPPLPNHPHLPTQPPGAISAPQHSARPQWQTQGAVLRKPERSATWECEVSQHKSAKCVVSERRRWGPGWQALRESLPEAAAAATTEELRVAEAALRAAEDAVYLGVGVASPAGDCECRGWLEGLAGAAEAAEAAEAADTHAREEDQHEQELELAEAEVPQLPEATPAPPRVRQCPLLNLY